MLEETQVVQKRSRSVVSRQKAPRRWITHRAINCETPHTAAFADAQARFSTTFFKSDRLLAVQKMLHSSLLTSCEVKRA